MAKVHRATMSRYHTPRFPSYASVALARSSHNVCADERIRQCMSKHPTLGSTPRTTLSTLSFPDVFVRKIFLGLIRFVVLSCCLVGPVLVWSSSLCSGD